MKKNFPVTNREHPLPPGATLVSKTDLKGVITYANDDFVSVSGFERDELLGRSHNLVRHPDMPPEAFQDMWSVIQSGRPWRGLVKNRCKNGDHYWVKALIVPVSKNRQVQGYMSVRTEAARHEVEAADRLYREIREGKRSLRTSHHAVMRLMQRVPFDVRQGAFSAAMLLLTIAAAGAGIAGWKEAAIGACFMAAAFTAIGTYFIARTVSGPLHKAIGYFDQISQGNLNNDIDVDCLDEAGRVLASLATTQAHLRVIIDEIRLSVGQLERRCAQLETEVENVTSHSRGQYDRITQVSVAMEEVSVSVTEVAKSAESAAGSAAATMDVVSEGNRRMTESMGNTDRVVAAVQASSQDIDRLSDAIRNVGTMTHMIKEIAEQTNLLALNAAIEAARAGEHGRGFAVVADEVRKLAERTAQSTGDIDKMVEEIQGTTVSAVASMRQAAGRVDEGRQLIGETHESFQKITEASAEVTRVSSHIASAAKEQSTATEEVARNTEHMSELIERSTASLQQVEQEVVGLRNMANQLKGLVAHFNG